jgi:aminoglycoside phosphotransferase (APT) family kinase protein
MEITTVAVEQGLQQFFGSMEGRQGGTRVSDVSLLGSGFETDVFAFSMADGETAGEELVLRIYAGEGADEKATREFDVMARLREAGYPVPRVLSLQRDSSLMGRPFLILERIHGGPMRWEFQELLCRLMTQLHALEPSRILPDSTFTGTPAPSVFVDQELSRLHGLLERLEGWKPASMREVMQWLDARRSTIRCERLSVIHGDFHPNNVLLQAGGTPSVIDWSNARLADSRTDLAWARLLLRVDTYPDRGEASLRTYERLAGREVESIDYFEVIAGVRLLLSVLISLRSGAACQGMRSEAVALMRRDAACLLSVPGLLQERTQVPMPELEAAIARLLQ